MSFTSRTASTVRPDRVKPPRPPSPTSSTPTPPSWSKPPASDDSEDDEDQTFHDARFPPTEEAALLAETHSIKADANAQFAAANYSQAISTYDRALASCPNYLDYEIAVLQSNISACHIKLEEWREAIESADRALEALDREDPPPKPKRKKTDAKSHKQKKPNDVKSASMDSDSDTNSEGEDEKFTEATETGAVVELPSDSDDATTAAALQRLNLSDERKASITRIRTKSLLRRARARSSLASSPPLRDAPDSDTASQPKKSSSAFSDSPYALLTSSLSDYTLLSAPPYYPTLPPSDARTVTAALATLPPQIERAKQKETDEMMAKLKTLGNGILKPFGLSTDNFKMVKDEKTGGYSMSFEQGRK